MLVIGGCLAQAPNFSFLVTTQTHQPKAANAARVQNQTFLARALLACWGGGCGGCPEFWQHEKLPHALLLWGVTRTLHVVLAGDYQDPYGHSGVSSMPVCCRLFTEQDFLLWFKLHSSPEHKVQYFTKSTVVIRKTWSTASHILNTVRKTHGSCTCFVHI